MRAATNIGDAIWRAFLRWSRLDFGDEILTSCERWSIAAATVSAVLRTRYHRPARLWLLSRAPAWAVTRRLEARSHSWHRVPNVAAAEHVQLRFGIWPVDVGDHVRIQGGRLTAIAYATPTFSEIIYVLPNGEPEPDPVSLWLPKGGHADLSAR